MTMERGPQRTFGQQLREFPGRVAAMHTMPVLLAEGTLLKLVNVTKLGQVITGIGLVRKAVDVVEGKLRTTEIGRYMKVSVSSWQGLPVGGISGSESLLMPGDKIGRLDFNNSDLKDIAASDPDPVSFARFMYEDAILALRELATRCMEGDPMLDGVNYFYGISRFISPVLEKRGFKVSDLHNPFSRIFHTLLAEGIAWSMSGQSGMPRGRHRKPMIGFISRETLVKNFGESPVLLRRRR